MKERFFSLLNSIKPADEAAMAAAKRRWNAVAKPIGSLGILESDIIKIAGITGDAARVSVGKSALVVMCADHGVVAEGVSQTGQEVTRIVAENFTTGRTSTSIMCRVSGTDVFPVDMGMAGEPLPGEEENLRPCVLLNRRIAAGSRNLVQEPAMDEAACIRALLSGMEIVRDLKEKGYDIIATGEMGIGNTTPSSAMAAVFLGLSPEETTGRGAGLSDEGLLKKRTAVQRAVERFSREEETDSPLHVLASLGGFDIAGLVGLFLGGAVYRVPMVIDGFISSVAALCAMKLCPLVKDFLLASHISAEPAGRILMESLGLLAPLDCRMHLGEGSGAVALLPLLSMGCGVYETMSTFDEIQVETYVDYEEEKKKP